MAPEKDYVLGTHDEELLRLGLQHRVWRPKMLEAWIAAGITSGSRVLDLGCGPGYASFDLSEIVGSGGTVLGVERSARFVSFAREESGRRGLRNTSFLEADLTQPLELAEAFDALWCRWVASFVTDLPQLVRTVHAALRPGGRAVFHEYVNYATWRTIPRSVPVESFVAEVMDSWRASGGEPDIAYALLPALGQAGLEIVDAKPIIFSVGPASHIWTWPSAFLRSNLKRLVESGRKDEAWAAEVLRSFGELERSPEALMLTPMLLQVIARRR
jgi:SAM-dependent methyltransferase